MLGLAKKTVPAEFKVDESKRQVTGYASVFGNVDRVGDIVHPGAYKDTIRDRLPRNLIKCMWNHRHLIGRPVHLEEDSTGLLTVNELSETSGDHGGTNALILLKDRALTHMSIMYRAVEYDYEVVDEDEEVRNLRKLTLFEQGYVNFPANEEAEVVEVPKGLQDLSALLKVLPKDLVHGVRADRYTSREQKLITAAAERLGLLATELKELLSPPPEDSLDPEGLRRLREALAARRALAH